MARFIAFWVVVPQTLGTGRWSEARVSEVEGTDMNWPNQITAANAGERLGFAGKSRVDLSARPGVAEFNRWAK